MTDGLAARGGAPHNPDHSGTHTVFSLNFSGICAILVGMERTLKAAIKRDLEWGDATPSRHFAPLAKFFPDATQLQVVRTLPREKHYPQRRKSKKRRLLAANPRLWCRLPKAVKEQESKRGQFLNT